MVRETDRSLFYNIVMKFDSIYRALLTRYTTVILGTDSTDSPDRLPILLNLSVFTF